MFRALKWAYSLGVRQERVRISAHLQVHSQHLGFNSNVMDSEFDAEIGRRKPNRTKAERLRFSIEVNRKVSKIIDEMFKSHGDWTPGASIMFPDDEHKGKVK